MTDLDEKQKSLYKFWQANQKSIYTILFKTIQEEQFFVVFLKASGEIPTAPNVKKSTATKTKKSRGSLKIKTMIDNKPEIGKSE